MARDEVARVGTGVRGLDEVLRGGLPAEHLYLVNGPSGCGKTTLVLQFLMEGARRGEPALYIGTSESEADIQEVARSHGWDLSGVEIRYHGGPAELTRGPEQTMLHPLEVQLPRTMEELMKMVDEVSPARLVIDSLTEIRLLAREPHWFRDQIKILQRHLAGRRCTTMLTDLPMPDQPVVRSIVHGVIELEQDSVAYGPDRRWVRVAKVRGMAYATGRHDVAIGPGGISVYPRLVAAEHPEHHDPETVSSGLLALDDLLGGGIDRGTATLFLGPIGTGKSTLVIQYVVAAARRGEKSAMYIFDERTQTLFQRAAGLGLELEEHVKAGLVTVRQVDPVELTPAQFSQTVVRAVDEGASFVALDSLNGFAYAMPEERLLPLHLHELLSYLNQRGVTSLLVMTQHGLLDQPSSEFDVSYIADTLVLVRPFEFKGRVRKALSVHKRRGGPHEKTVREFDLREGKVIVGPPLEQFSGVLGGHLTYLGEALERTEDER